MRQHPYLIEGKLVEIARVSKDEQRTVYTLDLAHGQPCSFNVRTMTEFHSTCPAQLCLNEAQRSRHDDSDGGHGHEQGRGGDAQRDAGAEAEQPHCQAARIPSDE
jgi:hypothetical protein